MPEQFTAVLDSIKAMWEGLLRFLPQLLLAIILFVIGWLVALALRFVLEKFLKLIRFNVVTEKAGIDKFLLKGGVQYSSISVLSNFVYWCALFALALAVLSSIGIHAAEDLFNNILSYIPSLLLVAFIIIFGAIIAKFMRVVIFTYLSSIKISGADFFSSLVQWAIILLVISLAFTQLPFGNLFVVAFEIAFGGICFAFAIAFGLAGKEWATQILEKLWRKSR
ncbi:MAG: hypothetical protein KBG83_02385 [Bacteroidetes bacterium]|nr:hypothetical protein [Bacteroidota bacterium]